MRKIILLKVSTDSYDYEHDFYHIVNATRNTDWQEVSDETFDKLTRQIETHNRHCAYTIGYKFVVIEEVVLQTASNIIDADIEAYIRRTEEELRIKKEKAEAKKLERQQSALDKKKKQLEKLQAELKEAGEL